MEYSRRMRQYRVGLVTSANGNRILPRCARTVCSTGLK
ncbi:unnamed protein product [Chondrus crispus]|uniref:Uncharacterized protein n=1 Tax=Chondrus crispus TaxID=2769 RepID=R7QKL8_CHOCR|nr:unnamed protein product [Chondrus crispus]CDF38323.1 unnamed protein product [Chondrus crispus]|eukprot:XP_005718208.1 unnamed protein product [Chondrus crispus]